MSAIRETITLTRTQTGGHAVADEITVPAQLGPVRLRREIGRGGMGVVHLARHELLERDVAVKFLLHVVAGESDPAFTQFLTGARAASAVRHAALNTIHHADIIEGVPYLVMEYIDGPSLRDVLRDRGRLSLSATLGVLRVVCDAIGELHDRNIVHHDVKPSNILLDRDGKVFVTDFGLAAVRKGGAADPMIIAGSPAYMAPELFEGVASLRTDVYALGVMTYELLTGELPFSGDSDVVRRLHAETPMPRGPIDRAGIDPAVVAVIERAMHKQPVFRYKSARHFLTALQEAVPDRAVWIRGESMLPELVVLRGDASAADATARMPEEGSSSYYERLSARAAAKRAGLTPSSPATKPPAGAPTLRIAPGILVAGVPCVGCGYDLRGLARGSGCPECGRPLADSVYPERLLFGDVRWRTRLHRSFRWVPAAIATLVISAVCVMLLGPSIDQLVAGIGPGMVSEKFRLRPSHVVRAILMAGCLGAIVIAVSQTTTRAASRANAAARIARMAAAASFALIVVELIARIAGVDMLVVGGVVGSLLALLASLAFVARLGTEIARRLPDAGLQRRWRVTGGLLLCSSLAPLAMILVTLISDATGGGSNVGMIVAVALMLFAYVPALLAVVAVALFFVYAAWTRRRLAGELSCDVPFERAFAVDAGGDGATADRNRA